MCEHAAGAGASGLAARETAARETRGGHDWGADARAAHDVNSDAGGRWAVITFSQDRASSDDLMFSLNSAVAAAAVAAVVVVAAAAAAGVAADAAAASSVGTSYINFAVGCCCS